MIKGNWYEKQKMLMILALVAVVTVFCVLAAGAGKNNEQTYIGTWMKNGEVRIVVYPCHTGEGIAYDARDGTPYVDSTFSWEVDNGYLVMHEYYSGGSESIGSYLSSDGGKTMTRVTYPGGTPYEKAD